MLKLQFSMLMCAVACVCQAQSAIDKEAVRQVVVAFQNDFNEGSFSNGPAYATSDWVHISPIGSLDRGRDAVLKTTRAVHQSFLKGVSMVIDSMQIRFITPDVAIADVVHTMTEYTTPDGVTHPSGQQIKTYVIVKQNGKWLLTHDHNTFVQRFETR